MMSSLPRALQKASELANIPDEAIYSLTPPGERVEHASQNNIDPFLIPRIDILRRIVFCLCEKKEEVPPSNPTQNTATSSNNAPGPSNKRLTLRGMGGLGKSTLAAVCVSFTDVRSEFDHML